MALRLSGSLAARPSAHAVRGAYYFATATAEVFTVDLGELSSDDLGGTYFTCADSDGPVYFWFNSGADPDPAPGGRGIEVTSGSEDDPIAMLAAVVDAEFTLSASGSVVTITNTSSGSRTNAAAGTSGATVTTTVAGGADASSVSESDGTGWVPRTIVDRTDIVDRTQGELADIPEARTMVGWLYFATDTEDTYEAFPTGWFLFAAGP